MDRSWRSPSADPGVHHRPIPAFTMVRSRRSRWPEIRIVTLEGEPGLMMLELLRRARAKGYDVLRHPPRRG